MPRNIDKMKKEGERIIEADFRYALYMSELQELFAIYRNAETPPTGIYRAITAAYLVGLASGCRYGTKKERKKQLQSTAG